MPRDLVVDRSELMRVLFGEDAVPISVTVASSSAPSKARPRANPSRRRARADASRRRRPGRRRGPAKSVGVSHRHDPDPGLLLGDVGAAVPRALPRPERLHERDGAPPTGPARGRARPGRRRRREAVERDAAAHRVEACVGEGERGGAVRHVHEHSREPLDHCAETLDLFARKPVVGLVRRGEVAHEPDDALAGDESASSAHAPPAHAGVDLEVDGDALSTRASTGELEAGLSGELVLTGAHGAHDDDARIGAVARRSAPSRAVATHSAAAPSSRHARATSRAPCPYASALTTAHSSAGAATSRSVRTLRRSAPRSIVTSSGTSGGQDRSPHESARDSDSTTSLATEPA